jgi:homoserine kinase
MSVTVELDERTAALVQELAAKDQRSASELIHDALTVYARQPKVPELPSVRRRQLPKGAGKYRSGRPEIAQNVREILRQDVQENKWP